jgi:hypothetical protein
MSSRRQFGTIPDLSLEFRGRENAAGLMTLFPTNSSFPGDRLKNSNSSPMQLDAPISCQVIVEHFTDERVGELLVREPWRSSS